jgi:hypothetical protein
VVVVGAERIGALGMSSDQVADFVHQDAAAQAWTPRRQRGRVEIEPPAAVDGESTEAFRGQCTDREQRMGEVWRVLDSDESCRHQQPLFATVQWPNGDYAALISPASEGTPMIATPGAAGGQLGAWP